MKLNIEEPFYLISSWQCLFIYFSENVDANLKYTCITKSHTAQQGFSLDFNVERQTIVRYCTVHTVSDMFR